MKRTALDMWLDDLIICGWTFPITRRRALAEMVAEGCGQAEAIKALCWYKAVEVA